MKTTHSFLTLSELEQYNREDSRIRRYIIEDSSDQKSSRSIEEQELGAHFYQHLNILTKGEYRWFKCCFIKIVEGDGSSWSSQLVNDKVAERFSHFHRLCLAYQINFDRLPLIADIIGKKRFLKAAVDNRLTTSFVGLKNWLTPLIIIAAVMIGILTKALDIVLKYKTEALKSQPAEILADPWFIGITGSLIILGLLSQKISVYFSTKTKSKSIENFLEQLKEKQNDKTNFDKFIDDLAARLVAGKYPRFAIIDNFGRLDEITKLVIVKYFQNYAKKAAGSEYWVVFETEGYDRLSSILYMKLCNYALEHSRHFQQRLLNTNEKRNLISQLKIAAEPEDFISVKDLCQGNEQTRQNLHELFQNYRSQHPKQDKRYDSIDFLYLISITSYPGKTPFEDRFLINNLSAKSGLHCPVLDKFLEGTRRQKIEFKNMLAAVRKDFDYSIILENKEDLSRLTVTSEIARYLESKANSLELAPPGLGHLYWSLFWYYKLRNAPIQSFFIRKLSHHLSHIDLTSLEQSADSRKIIRDIFEAHLFAIDGAMKICLFEPIPTLIENVIYLTDDDNYESMESDCKRLYERAWEAYLTLGEEKLLESILDIFKTVSPAEILLEKTSLNPLDVLYFESAAIDDLKRATLRANYDHTRFGNPNSIEAISNYAKSCSGWLSTTLLQMSGWFNSFKKLNIVRASVEALSTFHDLSERCQNRVLNGPSDHRQVIDILSLSLLQWSSGLTTGLILNLSDEQIVSLQAHINALVNSAENVVILANELKSRPESQMTNTEFDYLLSVLLQDICLISISSILVAERCLGDFSIHFINREVLEKINRIIDDINILFEFKIPGIQTLKDLRSPKLCEKLDSMLKLCCLIYRHFKLTLLHDFLELRRLQYTRICLGVNLSAPERVRSFSDSLTAVLDRYDYTGIMANFVLANMVHESIELRTHYVRNACKIAIESKMGDVLKRELSILAVRETHSLHTDPLMFVEQLLYSNSGTTDYLAKLIEDVPENDLNSVILCLLNTAANTRSQEARTDLQNVVAKHVERLVDSDLKKDLTALIEFFKFKEKVNLGEKIDMEQIIEDWEKRKHLWMYVGIINAIIENGYSSDRLADEAFAALNHDAAIDNFNVHFFLAINTLEKYAYSRRTDERFQIALQYLKKSLPNWEKFNSVETNLRAYRMLHEIDHENKDKYLKEITHWQIIKTERDHLQRLPVMAAQGQYFLIFYDYFESMFFWGLNADISFNDLYDKINTSPENKINYLNSWKAAGGEIPNPWLVNSHQRCISSEFLCIGYFLFNPPASNDQQYNEDRQRVNMIAKKHLHELVFSICKLPKLPGYIRNLIEKFSQRYQAFQLPEDK